MIERGARRVEADAKQSKAGEGIARQGLRLEHLRHGLTGGETDFDRTNELGRVVGMNALRLTAGSRRARRRCSQALPRCCALWRKRSTQVLVPDGACEEAFDQCAKIEAGSAGDDGEFGAGCNVAEDCAGLAAVLARGERLVGVGDIDEVMRELRALFGRGFGGSEIHAAIDGDGIATDDFAMEALGQRQGQRGFAAARGAEEQDDERDRASARLFFASWASSS